MKKNISLIVSFIGVFIIGVIIGRFILAPHPPLLVLLLGGLF